MGEKTKFGFIVAFIFLFFAGLVLMNIYVDYLAVLIFNAKDKFLNDSLGIRMKYLTILVSLMMNCMTVWFIRFSYRIITGKQKL